MAESLDASIDPKRCSSDQLPDPDAVLSPSALNEYISFSGCNRYFAFRSRELSESVTHDGSEYREAFEPLNPLLEQAGEEFEELVETQLESDLRSSPTDCEDDDAEASAEELVETIERLLKVDPPESASFGAPEALLQVTLQGSIGVWAVSGDADLLLCWPTDEGVLLRVIDIKSSQEQKTSHQIQTAAYSFLLDDFFEERGLADRVDVETGVISRQTEISDALPGELPSFDRRPREKDVQRLCRQGGDLHRVYFTDLERIDFTLDKRCAGCAYNEGCHTDAIEAQSLHLLGLSPSEQETLKEHDVESVEDLASLAYSPDERSMRNFSDLSPKDRQTWSALLTEPGIGDQLSELVQRAQVLAGSLGSKGLEIDTTRYAQPLLGTGSASLPDDDPYNADKIDFEPGTLVRCYLNVQVDHHRDRINMLSCRVTARESDAPAQRFSVLTDGLPDERAKAQQAERDVLTEFVSELRDALSTVTDGLSVDGESVVRPPVHFYTYTAHEQEGLEDALDRHADVPEVAQFQSLIDCRESIDQAMLTPVLPEISRAYALKTPTDGLVHLTEQMWAKYGYSKSVTDWVYTPQPAGQDDWADGQTEVDLRQIFGRRLFHKTVPYAEQHGSIELFPEESSNGDYDGEFPSRPRYGSDIPLGYQWAAVGRIDESWLGTVVEEGSIGEWILSELLYHDHNDKERRIRSRDLRALGCHLADALEHVEEAIEYKSHDLAKAPLEAPPAEYLSPSGPEVVEREGHSLARGSAEYIYLENAAGGTELQSLYEKPPLERVLTGESIPVIVRESTVDENDESILHVEAVPIYDQVFDSDHEQIRRRCRRKDGQGTTSGDWVVMTPYEHATSTQPRSAPWEIQSCPPATIETIDFENNSIELSVRNFYGGGEFRQIRDSWAASADMAEEDDVVIDRKECFILDPRSGGVTEKRCMDALDHSDLNHLHNVIERLRYGTLVAPETTTLPSEESMSEVLEWIENNYGPGELPGKRQRAFIDEFTAQFQLLQGPPGTGKTDGAEGPAIATRVLGSALSGDGFAGAVVGPSNRSVDEVLESTAEVIDQYLKATDLQADIELVRLTDDPPAADVRPPRVTYVNYNEDQEAVRKLGERLKAQRSRATERAGDTGQSTLTGFGSQSDPDAPPEQTIVFTTPTRAWGLIKRIKQSESSGDRSPDATELANWDLWDVLAVDEASMLTLPRFLLAGAQLKPGGQVLVAGDHRQMPPVQQHEWDEERREPIRQTGAYLSALDYLRFLSGEDDVLSEEQLDHIEVGGDRDSIEIPMERLTDGRRCADEITTLLQSHVYQADGIVYDTVVSRSAVPVNGEVLQPVQVSVGGSPGISLVVYQDTQYQQVNPIEVSIIERLLEAVPQGISTGVVTPHNAQRGAVEGRLEERGLHGPQTSVDTVERYQGDERDLIILSGTVSDPDYVAAEDKFLLSLNRATVAMSRAKRKLVVVVAESVIDHIPEDPDTYNEATLWKGLSVATGHADPEVQPAFSDTLSAFDPPKTILNDAPESIPVEVYPGLVD